MDFMEIPYYRLNRILLLSVGLQPREKTRLVQIQKTVISVIFFCGILFQLTAFITLEFSVQLLLKIVPFIILIIIVIVKYCVFSLNAGHIKKLMDMIHRDWNSLTDQREQDILTKYAAKASHLTIVFALFVYQCFLGFVLTAIMPDILDLVAPLNETRMHFLPMTAEIFLDQEEYFYLIFILINILYMVSTTTVVATETTYMLYIQHACGIFDIVGFSEFLRSTFATSYFILTTLGVAALTLNLYNVWKSFLLQEEIKFLLTHFCFLICCLVYLFYCNYMGQQMIDYSTYVFKKTYESQWYEAPLFVQKLILVIMQRSTKPCTLICGAINVPSYEAFSSLTSMSFSYFAFIYSMGR